MSHSHSHGHGHSHVHFDANAPSQRRRLQLALGLSALVLVGELVGGWLANSLALLADAGHLATDVAALGLTLFVAWFSRQPTTPEKSYGYLRWEILAAFLNGATLLAISAWIVVESVLRFRNPEPVVGGTMFAVATAGLVVNLISAYALRPASDTSLNVRGAYLHILGDLLGSVGTVIAAGLIHWMGWLRADSVASIAMSVLILRGAWELVRESVDVLLEATPSHLSPGSVRAQLEAIPGVESVHDLHIWTVTSNVVSMSVHAIVRDPSRHQHVLEHAHDAMQLFGIQHLTMQIEESSMAEREGAHHH